MIQFTPEAAQQLDDLRHHYQNAERLDALRNLEAAMFEAATDIGRDPAAGFTAPRPYPQIARPGQRWVKARRYWVAYRTTPMLAITAVFYDRANIPNRL